MMLKVILMVTQSTHFFARWARLFIIYLLRDVEKAGSECVVLFEEFRVVKSEDAEIGTSSDSSSYWE